MKLPAAEHFINRELSWLEFNQRVLEEAANPRSPLFERLKFLAIASSNLDEFFEVRVAGLKQQIEGDVPERSVDGLTAAEVFRAITRRVRRMVDQLYARWRDDLMPALACRGIRFLDISALDRSDLRWVEEYYKTSVRQVLTPLAIDPAHPFPQLLNKSLNMMVQLRVRRGKTDEPRLAVVQVPRVLPRLVQVPRRDGRRDYVFLAHLIGHFLADLFPGTKVVGYWQFRVTRNSELYIDEEEVVNLLKAVENELHNRRKGAAVRLEVEKDCPLPIRAQLLHTLNLAEDDLYVIDGPLNPTRLLAICEGEHSPELRDVPFVAPVAPALRSTPDLFSALRERDILLHHPYESFGSVVDFLEQAAADPNVLAIKQTLYRTGGDARIVGALMEAARSGKQVSVVVELRARFDEANNIRWSRQLEEAGVHVVYGLVGYKIHAKIALVVRREDVGIRRYVHVGTGNFNPSTARLYTDLSLLTCAPSIGEDATNLFNLLTGICQFQGLKEFLVAPFELHQRMVQLIEKETANAAAGLPARIIAKMNSLVDPEIIAALYRASQAGVKIQLIVRGICCLRPGVEGLSTNIEVRSIVGRFLEHSRIFYFENACEPRVYLGSADWMPRNFFGRIEVVCPVNDGALRDRLIHEILGVQTADNTKAWILGPTGEYRLERPGRGEKAVSAQAELMAAALRKEADEPLGGMRRRYPRVRVRRKASER